MERDEKLRWFERVFYYAVWSGTIFYSTYHVFLAKKYFIFYPDVHNDFSPGWSWIGGKRDTADYEWNTWIPLLSSLTPWFITHLLGSLFIKYITRHIHIINTSEILCFWYIIVSLHFLYNYFGVFGILCILIQPCISSLLLAINSKTITWVTNLIILTVINFSKYSETIYQYFVHLENEEYFMLMTVVCWTQLRSISFVMDNHDRNLTLILKVFFIQLLRNTAYNLYLPNLFLGPFILYDEFVKGISNCHVTWTLKRFLNSLFNILRYIFWLYFTEFALHFVYVNALQYHLQILKELDPWAFYGFGYCMGQYFLNKYVVIYGLGGEIARMDDIEAPPTPKCIGRIHLYSDMWKHFDVGLYKFLLKYIYLPTTSSNLKYRKLFGSFLCFVFVFMWHGVQKFIFVWSALNFVGIIIESIANCIGKSTSYNSFLERYFTPQAIRRFHCALSTPLLAMSAISNFYFFGGLAVGNLFFERLFRESSKITLVLLFSLYCCCQVSTDLKNCTKKKRTEESCKNE